MNTHLKYIDTSTKILYTGRSDIPKTEKNWTSLKVANFYHKYLKKPISSLQAGIQVLNIKHHYHLSMKPSPSVSKQLNICFIA